MQGVLENSAGRQKPYFDRDTTAIIKGVALVMMFAQHMLMFPEWWPEGTVFPFMVAAYPYLRQPMTLSVAVFCFFSGYFYFYNKDKTYSYSFRKITDLLINYWVIFFLFAFLAVSVSHYVYTPAAFLQEMFALRRPTMVFGWYVSFYYTFMLLLPLLTRILLKNIHVDLLVAVVLLPTCLRLVKYAGIFFFGQTVMADMISHIIENISAVLIGYMFAGYDLFGKMEDLSKRIHSPRLGTVLCWICVLLAPMGIYLVPTLTLDFFVKPVIDHTVPVCIPMSLLYAPPFIFCLVKLIRGIRLTCVKVVLRQIGKYSLLMWFVSCIFFNNSKKVSQPLLYWPGNPVLVLLWGLLLCYVVSALLDPVMKLLIKQKNRIFFGKKQRPVSGNRVHVPSQAPQD